MLDPMELATLPIDVNRLFLQLSGWLHAGSLGCRQTRAPRARYASFPSLSVLSGLPLGCADNR